MIFQSLGFSFLDLMKKSQVFGQKKLFFEIFKGKKRRDGVLDPKRQMLSTMGYRLVKKSARLDVIWPSYGPNTETTTLPPQSSNKAQNGISRNKRYPSMKMTFLG